MLRRIYVHNYRSLVDFEWSPPMACVLVGENGAGKSALFEVLCLLQDVVVHGRRIEETGFPATRTAWLDEPAQVIELELDQDGEQFRYRIEARLEEDLHERRGAITEQLSCADEQLYAASGGTAMLFGDAPGPEPRAVIPFDRRRSFLAAIEPGSDYHKLARFRDALAAMWLLKPAPLRIGRATAQEARWLDRDLGNFPGWYLSRVLEDLETATRLREDLARTSTSTEP